MEYNYKITSNIPRKSLQSDKFGPEKKEDEKWNNKFLENLLSVSKTKIQNGRIVYTCINHLHISCLLYQILIYETSQQF